MSAEKAFSGRGWASDDAGIAALLAEIDRIEQLAEYGEDEDGEALTARVEGAMSALAAADRVAVEGGSDRAAGLVREISALGTACARAAETRAPADLRAALDAVFLGCGRIKRDLMEGGEANE